MAAWLARRLAAIGIHYAWVMAAVTFLVMLSTAAAMGLPGVLIVPLEQAMGWNAADISGPLALRLLLFGLMGPFAAALLQRFGLRRVVLTALFLIIAGLALAAFATRLWQIWLGWGVMVGLGTGMTAIVLGATVANRWFAARRGLVIGLLTASSATGQLLFLPVGAFLATHLGWRAAVLPTAAMSLLGGVLMLLLGRDHPGELGLPAYGESLVEPPHAAAGNPARAALATLYDASASPMFWMLFFTFFVCGLSTNGLVQTHFIPLCHDFGLAEVTAASMLAAVGVFDFIGTILSGWLTDRFDSRFLLGWYYGLRGLSLLWLPSSHFTFYGLSVFAVFYGLDWVATVPPTVKLSGAAFGRERAGMVFGWVFMAHQLGAATAAYGGGISRSLAASYLPAFYTAGFACLLASLAAIAIKERRAPAIA